MDLKEMVVNMMNWIELAEVRNHWRALVDMVLNFEVLYVTKSVISVMNL